MRTIWLAEVYALLVLGLLHVVATPLPVRPPAQRPPTAASPPVPEPIEVAPDSVAFANTVES